MESIFCDRSITRLSSGTTQKSWWMGPQIRPWLEPNFVGLADWFFNLPLVPYLS